MKSGLVSYDSMGTATQDTDSLGSYNPARKGAGPQGEDQDIDQKKQILVDAMCTVDPFEMKKVNARDTLFFRIHIKSRGELDPVRTICNIIQGLMRLMEVNKEHPMLS